MRTTAQSKVRPSCCTTCSGIAVQQHTAPPACHGVVTTKECQLQLQGPYTARLALCTAQHVLRLLITNGTTISPCPPTVLPIPAAHSLLTPTPHVRYTARLCAPSRCSEPPCCSACTAATCCATPLQTTAPAAQRPLQQQLQLRKNRCANGCTRPHCNLTAATGCTRPRCSNCSRTTAWRPCRLLPPSCACPRHRACPSPTRPHQRPQPQHAPSSCQPPSSCQTCRRRC